MRWSLRLSIVLFFFFTANTASAQVVTRTPLEGLPEGFDRAHATDVSSDGEIVVGGLVGGDVNAMFIWTKRDGYTVIKKTDEPSDPWVYGHPFTEDGKQLASTQLYGMQLDDGRDTHILNVGSMTATRIEDLMPPDTDDEFCHLGRVRGIAGGRVYGDFHCGVRGATPEPWAFTAGPGGQATLLDTGRGLDGRNTSLKEMNNNGVGAGVVEKEIDGTEWPMPAKTSGGPFQELPVPSGYRHGRAYAINSKGDIGGEVLHTGKMNGIIWWADGSTETFDDIVDEQIITVREIDANGNAVVAGYGWDNWYLWMREADELLPLRAVGQQTLVDMSDDGKVLVNPGNGASIRVPWFLTPGEPKVEWRVDQLIPRWMDVSADEPTEIAASVRNRGDVPITDLRLSGTVRALDLALAKDMFEPHPSRGSSNCSWGEPDKDALPFECTVDELPAQGDPYVLFKLFVSPKLPGRYEVELSYRGEANGETLQERETASGMVWDAKEQCDIHAPYGHDRNALYDAAGSYLGQDMSLAPKGNEAHQRVLSIRMGSHNPDETTRENVDVTVEVKAGPNAGVTVPDESVLYPNERLCEPEAGTVRCHFDKIEPGFTDFRSFYIVVSEREQIRIDAEMTWDGASEPVTCSEQMTYTLPNAMLDPGETTNANSPGDSPVHEDRAPDDRACSTTSQGDPVRGVGWLALVAALVAWRRRR